MSKIIAIPVAQPLSESLDTYQSVAALKAQMGVTARNFLELSKRLFAARNIANAAIQKRHLSTEVLNLILAANDAQIILAGQIFGA